MPRMLYVHVGPRKTATSTLQSFLRDCKDSPVLYPKVGLYADGAHHRLVYRFFGEERRAGKNTEAIGTLLEKIAAEAQKSTKNVVISSEILSDASRNPGKFIRALMPCIGVAPDNVRILLACREHFERAASWYNMRIRAPKRINREQLFSPDEFLKAYTEELCYASLVERLKLTGFVIEGLNYHPTETWAHRFLRHIGFGSEQIPASLVRQRVGLSAKALIATMATNRVAESVEERRSFLEKFAAMPDSRASAGFIFGPEAAARAERKFGQDRDLLRQEFGIELVPPDDQLRESRLALRDADLEDIAGVARTLGSKGQKIMTLAREYLRD
jgi:hypothetical protein